MTSFSKSPEQHFDMAIIGAGMSGLMLAKSLMENQATQDRRILLLDRSFTEYDPRTWCYWEKGGGRFDHLVEKQWRMAEFFEGDRHTSHQLDPYVYKMLDGQRYRAEMLTDLRRRQNVVFAQTRVEGLRAMQDYVCIDASGGNYTASLVFDSRYNWKVVNEHEGLVLFQQFAGWYVRADQPVFSPGTARLMDFRMQQTDAVAFCYLLPMDAHNALVEYTLFTKTLQPEETLEKELSDYLAIRFPGTGLEVRSKEKGVIPMTDLQPDASDPHILPIGMAGGCAKPSSGYTFMFARQHTKEIIAALNSHRLPKPYRMPKKFFFYDKVMLRILRRQPHRGAKIFFDLFQRNAPEKVLDFMSNRSTLAQEISIFCRLPIGLFLGAALREMFSGAISARRR